MSFLGCGCGNSTELLSTINTWTALNTFQGGLRTTIEPSDGNDVVNLTYLNSVIPANLLISNNVWTGSNEFQGGLSVTGEKFSISDDILSTSAMVLDCDLISASPPFSAMFYGVSSQITYKPSGTCVLIADYNSLLTIDGAGLIGNIFEVNTIRLNAPLIVSGAITNACGLKVFSPNFGSVSNMAISTQDICVGDSYTFITPPTNGAIIEGHVGIGNSAPLSQLTVGPSNVITFDPSFNPLAASTFIFGGESSSPEMSATLNVICIDDTLGMGGSRAQISLGAADYNAISADSRIVVATRINGTTATGLDPISPVGGYFSVEVLNTVKVLTTSFIILPTRHFWMSEVDAVTLVDPVDGGYFYVQGGALWYKGSAGTTTQLAPA